MKTFCRFMLALSLLAALSCSRSQPLNVVIFTFDTTRADALGCYGESEAATPNVDRLASEGVLFERCYAAVPLTLPSHSTILTGTYPTFHGVRDNSLFTLPEEAETLAEILKGQGYATGAAIAGFPLVAGSGINQGFDFFDDHLELPEDFFFGDQRPAKQDFFLDERPAGRVNEAILPWLKEHLESPFFVWIHYYDAHQPLLPPSPYNQLFANNLYLGELAYADECLGKVLDVIKDGGVAGRTIVVLTGDHGEGRGEHEELTHSLLAYNSTLHVPLIMKMPNGPAGTRVSDAVSSVDIMPTLLDLMGIEKSRQAQGRSLVPVIDQKDAALADSPPLYSETLSPRLTHGWGELRALYRWPYKYIFGPRPELYNLEVDPDERNDLVALDPETAEELKEELGSFIKDTESPFAGQAATDMDEQTLARLEALGYISTERADAGQVDEVLSAEGTPPQDRARDISLWSQARQLLLNRRFSEAREACRKLVENDPGNVHYAALLAAAYLNLGQIDQALTAIEGTDGFQVSYSPVTESIYVQIAIRLFGAGERSRALAILEWLAKETAGSKVFFALAQLQKLSGNHAAYRMALEEGLRRDADDIPARVALAADNAAAGKLAEAEAEFRRVLQEHPRYCPAQYNYALVLANSGRLEKARLHLVRAIRINPRYWPARLGLIAISLDLGDKEAAKREMYELESLAPGENTLAQAHSLLEMP